MRTGLLATKIGMTRIINDDGVANAVTVLQVSDCSVVDVRRYEGKVALQVGSGAVNVKRLTKSLKGFYEARSQQPKRDLVEFVVSEDCVVDAGQALFVDHFIKGQKIDATSVGVGKGFAGAMKRHNFGGLRASHGVSISHRSHGSTGQCQDPGKVFKNKKMAGQMGNRQVTVHNLDVLRVDSDAGLIFVNGSVPGSKGTIVKLRDAIKINHKLDLPKPTFVKNDSVDEEAA